MGSNPLDMRGKVILVTGSSKGIGRGIALELAHQGATIVINYRSDPEGATRVTEEIAALGLETAAVAADVGVEADVDQLIRRTLDRFNRLDVLVNNAAIGGGHAPLLELGTDTWLETQRVNLLGVFLCTQRAARAMIPRGGGAIVNIGSIAPMMAYPNISDYNASKGAVHAFTQTAARELGPFRIRVNGVAAGSVPDGMNRERMTPERLAQATDRALLGRLGVPADIGKAVAFLASDAADWITGQMLVVDGGTTIQG